LHISLYSNNKKPVSILQRNLGFVQALVEHPKPASAAFKLSFYLGLFAAKGLLAAFTRTTIAQCKVKNACSMAGIHHRLLLMDSLKPQCTF